MSSNPSCSTAVTTRTSAVHEVVFHEAVHVRGDGGDLLDPNRQARTAAARTTQGFPQRHEVEDRSVGGHERERLVMCVQERFEVSSRAVSQPCGQPVVMAGQEVFHLAIVAGQLCPEGGRAGNLPYEPFVL
ncbi:hypothetical protein ACLQ2N_21675 [Streptomyces sp. DT224]|uniref:hypothetical protein n=1 Tax=Streptomyces sp. DT224 TaxID=3393426 RepID=UPI003CFAADB1